MLLIFPYLYVCCAEEEFSLFHHQQLPLNLAALAHMKNWRELKMYHFPTSLGLCTTKKCLCCGETTERAGKKKRRKIPWRKLSRTLNPAGCQSCLWEEPWVWLLIISLCLARQFPGFLSMQGLLSPPSLISSSALPKQRASWHVNSRQQWIILPASHPLWLI